VEKFDLPSVDALNTYIIAKKVAGEASRWRCRFGGDELFGGYPSFRTCQAEVAFASSFPFPRFLGRLGARARGQRLSDLLAAITPLSSPLASAILDRRDAGRRQSSRAALDCGEIPDCRTILRALAGRIDAIHAADFVA